MNTRRFTVIEDKKYLSCTCCRELKPEEEFSKETRAITGRCSICRVCQKYRMKLQNYGITREQYEQMLTAQDHKCKICACTEDSPRCTHKHFVVDHCHSTGKVRSLLCDMCNKTLGYTNDSKELLEAMIKYLDEHNSKGNI